ncbi:MAG: urease subunit gamma [Candidatus Latescibacteria bacterium]|nr:urease subunit gamma [Candidatus Latescibacterota bacterium]
MRLSPKEIDKLILHNAGFLAQKRYARGLKLNYPEATSLIAAQLLEFIRDGESVATLMNKGKQLLGTNDVLPGVAEMVHEVQIEGTFPDGTKLVTVHNPICRESGDTELALYSSGLTRTQVPWTPDNTTSESPGKTTVSKDPIALNSDRDTLTLPVTNTGDRPIQVGSHYIFFEVNPALSFDRNQAYGYRLNIPSGTAVRFELGETKTVELVALAGNRTVYGGNALISGSLDENKAQALQKASEGEFKSN